MIYGFDIWIYHILPCNVFIFVLFFNLKLIMPTLLFISAVRKRGGIQGSFSVPAESGYAHSKTQAYPGDPVFEFHQPGRVIEVLNVSEGLFSYSLLAWLIGNW